MVDPSLAEIAAAKDDHIIALAEDLITGTDIRFRTADFVIHKLTVGSVARRYINMLEEGKFRFHEEAFSTLFASNGENASLLLNDGFDAAVSLIEEHYDSIVELIKEDL